MMEPRKCPATGTACNRQCGEYQPCANYQAEKDRMMERRIQVDPWAVRREADYIYTILWYYGDRSDFGVLDIAFRNEEAAQRIRQLLEEHSGTKQFVICKSEIQR